ncbi:MAG: cation transporter [Nanoarchaeota archaeon]|nr:cation transporter [Nanoarchaeota archaeon]
MKSTITVKGMHCKSCEMLLIDSIGDLNGVTSVKADYKKGKVDVNFEAPTTLSDIKEVIIKEGYTS